VYTQTNTKPPSWPPETDCQEDTLSKLPTGVSRIPQGTLYQALNQPRTTATLRSLYAAGRFANTCVRSPRTTAAGQH